MIGEKAENLDTGILIFNFHLEYDINYSAMASLVVWSLGKLVYLDLLLKQKHCFGINIVGIVQFS